MPILLLLLACVPETADESATSDSAPPPDTVDGDPAGETGEATDTGGPGDTGPADSGEVPDTDGLLHGVAEYLAFVGCGTNDDQHDLLLGPDLDGDGVGELIVVSYGADTPDLQNAGVVTLVPSATTGFATVWDLTSYATQDPALGVGGFGYSARWLDDYDDDGVADLLVAHYGGAQYLVGGVDLLAGSATPLGSFDDLPFSLVRWADADGDDAADWLFGFPARDLDGEGTRGLIALVSHADFAYGGAPAETAWIYGNETDAGAGRRIALADDHDGDGRPDLLTNLDADAVLFDSSSIGVDLWIEDGARWRFPGVGDHTPSSLGDVDGGGIEDFAFDGAGELCFARGEEGDAAATPVWCYGGGELGADLVGVAAGPDADGDGDRELWAATASALTSYDLADALGGVLTRTGTRTLASEPEELLADADQIWLRGVDDGVDWVEQEVAWRLEPTAETIRTTLVGGGWGGGFGSEHMSTIRDFVWADVDGDGVDDAVYRAPAAWLWLFDGERLRAGGEFTLCDADLTVAIDALWGDAAGDLDGDGAEDLYLYTQVDGGIEVDFVSGAALAGGELSRLGGASVAGARYLSGMGCDLDGDGVEEFIDDDDHAYDGAGLLAGDATPLATMEGWASCLPDLDGCGRPDLALLGRQHAGIVSGSLATGGASLTYANGHTVLDPDYRGDLLWVGPLGDLEGDGVAEVIVEFRPDPYAAERLCVVRGDALGSAGNVLASSFTDCVHADAGLGVLELLGDTDGDTLYTDAEALWGWDLATGDTVLLLDPTTRYPGGSPATVEIELDFLGSGADALLVGYTYGVPWDRIEVYLDPGGPR